MTPDESFMIEGAGHGSVRLSKGDRLRITNIEGMQVVDFWAFRADDISVYLSTEHTRSTLQKLIPAIGDCLYDNQRRAIVEIVEDSSPGIHDLLLSACDEERYKLLGVKEFHKNCADNLRTELAGLGHTLTDIPSPFNIFENVEIGPNGSLEIIPPRVEAGQFITLEAHQDIIAVMSCCPMDIALTNGPDLRSKPAFVEKFMSA